MKKKAIPEPPIVRPCRICSRNVPMVGYFSWVSLTDDKPVSAVFGLFKCADCGRLTAVDMIPAKLFRELTRSPEEIEADRVRSERR